jgi:TetR/AcrR family transcriptional regulator, tetracycline repressor protein
MVRPAVAGPDLPYGALDREVLTRSLLTLAQRIGVGEVTMRGLATEAGTSASSVYYHVANKAEMLDLLIDAVVSRIAVPTVGSWQDRLVVLYRNAWRAMIDVPGIASLLQQRPHTHAADNMDRETRKILHESGLGRRDVEAAHAVLYIHLLGAVQLEHNRTRVGAPSLAPRASEATFVFGLRVILSGLKELVADQRQGTTRRASRKQSP